MKSGGFNHPCMHGIKMIRTWVSKAVSDSLLEYEITRITLPPPSLCRAVLSSQISSGSLQPTHIERGEPAAVALGGGWTRPRSTKTKEIRMNPLETVDTHA